MNGLVKMYPIRQIIRHDLKPSLPTCMYKMKNIHASEDDGKRLADHVSPSTRKPNISDQKCERETDMTELINRQEKILQDLDELRQQMISLKSNLDSSCVKAPVSAARQAKSPAKISSSQTIVINASPSHPPYSLLAIKKLWRTYINLDVQTYCHSTVATLSDEATWLSKALELNIAAENLPVVHVKLIWKNIGANTELLVSQIPIIGETNILRYLSRLSSNGLSYENLPNSFEIDSTLDICYCLVRSKTKTERAGLLQGLSKKLGKSSWLCGSSNVTIADLAASSAIKQVAMNEINQTTSKWLQKFEASLV